MSLFIVFLCLVGLGILYIIIETAVRRGLDSSKLSERIERLEDELNKRNSNE
ncbi:hypothetical protein SAMN05444672_11459 [Bacillus sp. OK838]|nr:hypothetical protein SAMN05444672_11459 [Bacillus sp. OK838]